jgi:hypothetical protein
MRELGEVDRPTWNEVHAILQESPRKRADTLTLRVWSGRGSR